MNHGLEEEETTLKPQGYNSALDYPLATLTANQIDRDTPHNDYKALDPERKKAVNGALDILARMSGKTIQLFGMPHVDLFNTGRILIPGVDFKMRFTLSDPKFFMNGLAGTATNVRLQSGDLKIKFFACLVKVRSDVYNSIATARLQRNLDVYYPTVRSEIRTYTIQNNQASFEATDVFNGRVPDRVVIGFLQQSCFTGSCAESASLNPKQDGRVKIDVRKTGGHTIVMIVYGEFENMMQIKPTGATQYDIYSQQLAGRIH